MIYNVIKKKQKQDLKTIKECGQKTAKYLLLKINSLPLPPTIHCFSF